MRRRSIENAAPEFELDVHERTSMGNGARHQLARAAVVVDLKRTRHEHYGHGSFVNVENKTDN